MRRVAVVGMVGMVAIGGGHARASNMSRPRTPAVFDPSPCVVDVDRQVDSVLRLPFDVLAVDVDIGADELPDSRTLRFFAVCRPLGLDEALPPWVLLDDAQRALDAGIIEMLPDAEEIAQTSQAWRLVEAGSDGCLYPLQTEPFRIDCADAAQGIQWDTSDMPAGSYEIWGHTFEPPTNLWTRRPGILVVHDAEATAPGVAITQVQPVDGQWPPAYAVQGCSATRASVELAWIDGQSAAVFDPAAWTVAARQTAGPGALSLQFVPPDDALERGVLLRVSASGDGPAWSSYADQPLVTLPDAGGIAPYAVHGACDGQPPAAQTDAARGCAVADHGAESRGLVFWCWLALPLVARRRRPMRIVREQAKMSRPHYGMTGLGAIVGLSVGIGCSALALRDEDCTSDDACESAFGAGFVCTERGTCEGPGGGSDGGTDTEGCVDGLCAVPLAEECGAADVPVLESSPDFVLVSTNPLRNDFDELSCLETPPIGNDGFVAVDLAAGERWHFHVRVTDDAANPSVYVLRGCDERSCQKGDGVDLCGDGADEHLSFVAPEAGRYFVGIDERVSGGAQFELLALQPTCGNGGMPEHSETCDDGNTTPLDGCDASCRAELRAAAPQEVEPNDDRSGANVLLVDEASGELTVRASVGGRCDFDNFVVTVPDGASLEAAVNAASGDACGAGAPPITMRLLAADAVTILGERASQAGQPCPSFTAADSFAADLAAGDYYVRVFTGEQQPAFDYALDVRVVPGA